MRLQQHELIMILTSENTENLLDGSLSNSVLEQWFKEPDIEFQGALYVFLTERRFSRLLEYRPTFRHLLAFLIRYFEYCIIHNPDGEWSDSRYSAARDIVGWVNSWVSDRKVDPQILETFFDWIKVMKNHENPDVKLCIDVGVLEKLEGVKGVPKSLFKE